MLKTLSPLQKSKSGQAMVEFLPAIMIFILVMSAGLAYFRVMRSAALREEAVRNLAFAKMDNAGTLTTVDSPDEGKSAAEVSVSIEGQSIPALSSGNNVFISEQVQCFSVVPEGQAQLPIEVTYRAGVTASTPVVLTTYGVVCRK